MFFIEFQENFVKNLFMFRGLNVYFDKKNFRTV